MINEMEKKLAQSCIRIAVENGADSARISLNKSTTDSCTMLNGELDKVTHSADRSIYIYLYAEGKYGTFSTNRLEEEDLKDFIANAVEMVRMLGEDKFRSLPDKDRTAKDAITGRELDLYDEKYHQLNIDDRLAKVESLSIFSRASSDGNYRIISEECEYSDSCEDNYVIDSQGFEGRHRETSFYCFTEMTIEDNEGNKYSDFWWEASNRYENLLSEGCAEKALEKAVRQIGPKNRRGGRYRMIVDRGVASRLVSPILSALNASSIQQKMSFLEDSMGKKIFTEGLTIMDYARTLGKTGSRLFDTEGVATKDRAIVENGEIKLYFVNTYMAKKMEIEPTIEDISRPCILPYMKGENLPSGENNVSLKDILNRCSNGIYVTGFNGGNCNPVTGDFSFGIDGFAFSKGKITHPVREMLITGNIIDLWEGLIAVGSDAKPGTRWQIGSLAFENVSFSA